jgi:AraC-like DNA-binding protein
MQDILHFFTLVGAVQGIFFSLVLVRLQGGNRAANRFLALFLAVFSLSMIGIVAYASRWALQVPHIALLHTPLGAILGLPFLLYIAALSQKKFQMRGWHWLLFLPFAVILLWLLPFYALSMEEKRSMLEASYTAQPEVWRQIFAFSNLCNFGYLVASYVLILRHERVIREVYSSPLNKTLLWTRYFLYGATAIFVVCVLMSFRDITWADSLSNFNFSLLIYVFGYRAMRQPDIFGDVKEESLPNMEALPLIRPSGKYEKSGLSEAKAGTLLERLEHLMAAQKIFLDPALNLQQLASQLEASPHQVSQLLNQFRGESFSDFVNRYRVEHFKMAAANPANAHLTLLALAFECGFNSKAAFNVVFKKMTGQTPSDFLKQVQ